MRGFGFGSGQQARRRLVPAALSAPTLGTLALSARDLPETSAAGTLVGNLVGKTPESTLTLVDSAGGRFALADARLIAGAVATDREAAAQHQVTIRETLAGARNSPRETVLTITVVNVFEQPDLAALGLSATSFRIGTAAGGTIAGTTAASVIVASALPAGLTIDGAARTWNWSGNGTAGSGTVTLTETLADSANSPRLSTIAVTVSPATLSGFRTALAAARAGTGGPLVVNLVGDSTVAGTGGGSPASAIGNNARANALNQKLAEAFAALGLTRNGADVFGFNFPVNTQTAADYAAWNTAISPGSWSFVNNLKSLGGNMWNAQASGADWRWTAEGRPFSKLVIYYPRNSGLGSFKILIDGSDAGTISCAGPAALGRTEITVAADSHAVALRWLSGSVYVVGMDAIDTTAPASVRVRNLGQGSARSTDIVSAANAWDARPTLAAIDAAHLHVIEGGLINDWLQGVAPATTSANLSAMMTAAQTRGGDVLLLGPVRSNTATMAAATQQATVDAMAGLANGSTRLFYDLKAGLGDYAAMTAAGRMFDNVHPNAAGYAAAAQAVFGALTG